MTYNFSKIETAILPQSHLHYVSKTKYIIYEDGIELGEYFITPQQDYFHFCNNELHFYAIKHLPLVGKRKIINQVDNKEAGYFIASEIVEKKQHFFGRLILHTIEYNISSINNLHKTTLQNFMISNNEEQVFISCKEKKRKINHLNVELLSGAINMGTENILLLFCSIYCMEEMLFNGNYS
jgi:hypothetical protein